MLWTRKRNEGEVFGEIRRRAWGGMSGNEKENKKILQGEEKCLKTFLEAIYAHRAYVGSSCTAQCLGLQQSRRSIHGRQAHAIIYSYMQMYFMILSEKCKWSFTCTI